MPQNADPALPLLVDTDLCVDVSRLFQPTIDLLDREALLWTLALSTQTYMELLVGCADKRQQSRTERFVRRFEVLPITEAVSAMALDLMRRYRLSHGLLIGDALIAATALAHDCPLLTKNQRDFRFIAGLRLHPLS